MYYLDWNTSSIPSVAKEIVIDRGVQSDLQTIYEVKFDSSGRYLEIARGNKLKILEVKQKTAQKNFEAKVKNIADLIFDQTGSFVFVAADNHLYIYNVETGKLAGTYSTPNITQLDISLDNRLVFWAEKAGQIHVLGILKPE
jgi:tricorn protease-like protein